eukprot:6205823-Pleurochrysis_carterae.AAC.2
MKNAVMHTQCRMYLGMALIMSLRLLMSFITLFKFKTYISNKIILSAFVIVICVRKADANVASTYINAGHEPDEDVDPHQPSLQSDTRPTDSTVLR